MQIQELAQLAIDLRAEDEVALEQWADVENDAFEAYLSDYNTMQRICKCCHG